MKTVKVAMEQGFYQEALLRAYHMNIGLMKHILLQAKTGKRSEEKKLKPFLKKFFKTHKSSPRLKSTISSRSVKSLRVWLEKTDDFFKTLKMSQPRNTKQLLEESTRIAGMLSISLNKIDAVKTPVPTKNSKATI